MPATDGSDQVGKAWPLNPLDGGYDTAATLDAAQAGIHLIRYLGRATAVPAAGTLPLPTDTAHLTTTLADAVALLPQLLRQLGERARTHAAQPGLRLSADQAGLDPAECAYAAAHALDAAARLIEWTATPLHSAGVYLGRLTTADATTGPDTHGSAQVTVVERARRRAEPDAYGPREEYQ